ncbi:MAG TPA: discoidin domain-containing protein, partial [Anaerolineales bacterium]|nr:discoidin domain-containing protein [Anaerolineales bacterium]
MKPFPSPEEDEQDQGMIELLKDLGSFKLEYPPELLAARRAAFLARVNELTSGEERMSTEDQEIVKLLGLLGSAQAEYPAHLLAARRTAFLRYLERAEAGILWNQIRVSIQRIFPFPGLMRISLVVGSLIAAVWIGSLFMRRDEGSVQPLSSQAAAAPTYVLPTTGEVAMTICKPEEQTASCLPGELPASQDLADPENGSAQPAVSKDARFKQEGVHQAAYVNDGREGASWVSNSADSWIKIDLGQVRTINTVSLQKGSFGSSSDNNPGQFVIAVALSDVYADGDSSHDYVEYAQVFRSEQTGFSGTVSHSETIQTQFPPVKARFVKITFEQAEVAIEEVGVFLVQPPELAEQSTGTPAVDEPEITSTPTHTTTPWSATTQTTTSVYTGTAVPTLTKTPLSSNTPTPLPTNTPRPTATSTPVPIEPSATVPLPTTIAPTLQQPPPSIDPIIITGSDQTLIFTCNGNAAEIRGHANTVTLLGSCSSITVTGNGNHVYWESGLPVITNKGKDNIIQQ